MQAVRRLKMGSLQWGVHHHMPNKLYCNTQTQMEAKSDQVRPSSSYLSMGHSSSAYIGGQHVYLFRKAWTDRKTQRISIWKWETLRGRRRSIVHVFCDWIIVPSELGKRDNPVKQADLWIFMTGPADLQTEGGRSQAKIKDQSKCEGCRTGAEINQSQHAAEGHWGPDVWRVWPGFEWLQKEGLLKAIQEGAMHAPATQTGNALMHQMLL